MAKKETIVSAPETFLVSVALPKEIEFNGVTIDLTEVAPAGIAYLLNYGFRQSLQDAVSGVAKEAKGFVEDGPASDTEKKKFRTMIEDSGVDPEVDGTEQFVSALLHAYMTERRDDILSGDVTVGGSRGARLSGIEKVMRDVADEWLKAVFVRSNKPLPGKGKGKDWTATRDQFLERFKEAAPKGFGSSIRAEAERRMVPAKTDGADDVLADLGLA